MEAPLFGNILKQTHITFLNHNFPLLSMHQFMQDNDSQNTSCAALQFYVNAGIIWWHTPPEFPDMNLIENIGLLKDYSLGSKNKEQGMANDFTMYVPVLGYTTDLRKCLRYIRMFFSQQS